MKTLGVLVGRFQPLHKGHVALIERALAKCDEVLILVGSAHSAISSRNPFTYEQRKRFIETALMDHPKTDHYNIQPINDHLYFTERWEDEIKKTIEVCSDGDEKVILFGTVKDHTTDYLREMNELFKHQNLKYDTGATKLTGSVLRQAIYNRDYKTINKLAPKLVASTYIDISYSNKIQPIVAEYQSEVKYRQMTQKGAFPVLFTAVDNMIMYKNELVMIRRKGMPGKDLWALPGGFLNEHELLTTGAAREALEETGINVYRENYMGRNVYDDPFRCTRGRIISYTHLWDMTKTYKSRPKLKAGDDAADANWFNIDSIVKQDDGIGMLSRYLINGDHYSIIEHMHYDFKLGAKK